MASKKRFKCPLCEKIFGSWTELKAHTISHTKEKPHKCPICSAAFGVIGNLREHIRAVHDGVTKFNCPNCDYKSYNRSVMRIHMQKHSSERPFSCTKPGCSFNTKYAAALRAHVRIVHNKIRPFKCQYNGCNHKAATSSDLQGHVKIHSNERHFSCTFSGCGTPFKRKGDLRTHISKVHNEEKPFKCSTCEFETKYKNCLRRHENTHRETKRFQCSVPKCHYASNENGPMQRHLDSKHRKKDILCPYPGCRHRYGSIALLKIHARRAHMCPILKCPQDSCNFSTKNPKTLRKHLTRHHGNDHFVTPALPKLSSRVLTAGEAVAQTQSQYKCPFPSCDYQTEFLHLYDRHIQTHDEKKGKYTCKFCPLKFRAYAHLEEHVQRHTREKPYSCSHCKFTTSGNSHLKKHAEKVHGIHMDLCRQEAKGVQRCSSCKKICMSKTELVLHSMKHLQVVVVLERLRVNIQ